MKCRKCGGNAVIALRYARMALCEKHFIEYVRNRVAKVIEKAFRLGLQRKVLVAVSGGKDSMVLLSILTELSRQLGFEVKALFIDLSIPGVSERAKNVVTRTCKSLGVELISVNLKDVVGKDIPELSKLFRKSFCATCGMLKRFIMNAVGVEGSYVVATGHHLDDVVTYIVKELLMARSSVEHLKVSDVVPPAPGACPKIRPLIKVSEREILAYAIIKGIEFIEERCPYGPRKSVDSYIKKLINELEAEYPGTKLGILSRYMMDFEELRAKSASSRVCRYCGLISSSDECSFCKYTKEAFGEALGPKLRDYVRSMLR